ncbi:S-adenosyl-L-methionine-dependent methyltransferase [Dactylonectria estremocensis]|uniref:tRNA wybutosine-synthesizing protein 4 n=1 Tax=Dactylonectria estremocensis TaxID=1079267 RepID=A0A9P9EBH8_9HYPO|nr:S-adenosyl-L-methionine-dependent methyltransferase [Dactylonectria estremocensis]
MTTPSSKPSPPSRQPKSQALDDLIMGTNSSSIVSKRSVERLYYPNEAHFFRYFVNKFQRRAPLINRGYWLRLRAIDAVVHKFLKSSPSGRKKVVINLGCGSDVLPWQCHTRYPNECDNTVFLDIDYPDLMRKKRAIVLGTPQLRELLGPNPLISEHDTDQILLRSDKYCQLGCDLRKLDALRQCLESFLPLSECSVLFVAEVSITYMDTLSADALIEWASSIGQAEFCLLEQILPNGPDHPFAKTMLSHFDKLNTPLKSVHAYPTLVNQTNRFRKRGWHDVDLWDLWEAWNSEEFLSHAERIALDDVEPFDEWEEFVLFARHYFVMHAIASPPTSISSQSQGQQANRCLSAVEICHHDIIAPKRRFGAPMVVTNPEGQTFSMNTFGMGNNGRVASYDVYTLEGRTMPLEMSPVGPPARMCHTSTDLGPFGILVAGGRASPSSVISDCWVFKRDSKCWEKTGDLPTPLFRHVAVRLRGSALALIFGGRVGPSQVSSDYFLFHPAKGWLKCATSGSVPDPTFGAVAISSPEESQISLRVFRGLLSGGMTRDGAINTKAYRWALDINGAVPLLNFEIIEELGSQGHGLAVFGAQVVDCGPLTAVCGGVGQHPSSQGQDIAFVSLSEGLQVHLSAPSEDITHKWPLMIGSSVVSLRNQLVFLGGGATCFSMGTYWETGVNSVDASGVFPSHRKKSPCRNMSISYVDSPKLTQFSGDLAERTQLSAKAAVTEIARVRLNSDSDFQQVLRNRKPVIIEGLNLGQCVENWTPEYMVHRMGEKKEVVVHECQLDTAKMDFNSKNFRYVTDSFKSFIGKAKLGQRLYLRSLSEEKPSEAPANIDTDFPSLADECSLPEELGHVKENLFSSVLRISGRVNMWLHYDVMANVYAQIRGSKRMVLFPPSDVSHLAFAPGASSSSLDVFSALEKYQLAASHPHEAVLDPGDVLFLPPMWFHTATPTTDMSVAVNFFFRDLHSGYSSGRDVYGNRDLAAYEKGRQDVARIAKGFDQLPLEIRQFYLVRLADELLHQHA